MYFKGLIVASLVLGIGATQSCGDPDPTAQCITTTRIPKPPKKYCGAHGDVVSPKVLGKPIQADCQESCRDACLDLPHCVSFGWDNGTCTFYGKTLQNMDFKRSSANLRTWNRNCYSRSCCDKDESRCDDGACHDFQNDHDNCGGCGNVCGSEEICSSGKCACPVGQSSCGNGLCFDLNNDHDNCGHCGIVCGDYDMCSAGRCVCNGNKPNFALKFLSTPGDSLNGKYAGCGSGPFDDFVTQTEDFDDACGFSLSQDGTMTHVSTDRNAKVVNALTPGQINLSYVFFEPGGNDFNGLLMNCTMAPAVAEDAKLTCTPQDFPDMSLNYWCDQDDIWAWNIINTEIMSCTPFQGFTVFPLCDFKTIQQ